MDRRAVELTGGFEFLGPLAQRLLGAGEGLGVASANPFADKPTRRLPQSAPARPGPVKLAGHEPREGPSS
jgi:hypothetical protein